jgi:hypothetical protein
VLSLTTSICHGVSRNGSCWGDASVIQGQSVLSVISWMASEIFNLLKLKSDGGTIDDDTRLAGSSLMQVCELTCKLYECSHYVRGCSQAPKAMDET